MRSLRVAVLLSGLLALASAGAQGQVGSVRGPVNAAGAQAKVGELNEAFQFGTFVEQNGEFKLNRTVTWDPKATDVAPVDFQVGTIQGKPAFVSVVVPKSGTEKAEDEIWAAIPKVNASPSPGTPIIQMCPVDSERVCVQTRGDGSCARYQCVPKKTDR